MRDEKMQEKLPTHFTPLLDKLGERLVFEGITMGLYDALAERWSSVPERDRFAVSLEDIERFWQEELAHVKLLEKSIRELGGSPGAPSTSGQLAAVASQGLLKVVQNIESSPMEALEAVLIAELTDHLGWELLVALARQCGREELAWEFQGALAEEKAQLQTIRSWVDAISWNAADEKRRCA